MVRKNKSEWKGLAIIKVNVESMAMEMKWLRLIKINCGFTFYANRPPIIIIIHGKVMLLLLLSKETKTLMMENGNYDFIGGSVIIELF